MKLLRSSNNFRVIAASLVETVISLAIVSTCLGVATLIFVNVMASQSSHFLHIKMEAALDRIIDEDYSKKIKEDEYTFDEVLITKSIMQLKNENYVEITYKARLGNKTSERIIIRKQQY